MQRLTKTQAEVVASVVANLTTRGFFFGDDIEGVIVKELERRNEVLPGRLTMNAMVERVKNVMPLVGFTNKKGDVDDERLD